VTEREGASYRDAGVDIGAGDKAVEMIRERARATRPEVLGDIGGFAGAFSARFEGIEDPVLVSGADGVGTKLLIAQTLDRHDTVGFDLVAMVVDDIVCQGAEPLFLLDYIACGKLVPDRIADIVAGIAEACRSSGCALLGGETAEHPGVMDADHYDLAAFAVGVVARDRMLGAHRVQAGDVLIGLGSSGLHSNGYSLVRKIILDHDLDLRMRVPGCDSSLGEELLTPTRIHAPAVLTAMEAADVHAAAHITGGGIAGNLARAIPSQLGARLSRSAWSEPPIFAFLAETGGIAEDEMDRVFNRGLGMAITVGAGSVESALAALRAHGETATVVGEIVEAGGVEIDP